MIIKNFLAIAAATAVFASCTKEPSVPSGDGGPDNNPSAGEQVEVPSDGLVDKVFTVSNVPTKTYWDGSVTDAGQVLMKWLADDKIGIHDGTALREFVMVSEPIEADAVFKGRVEPGATSFSAYYPYVEDLQFSYPAVQHVSQEGGLADCPIFATGTVDENDRIHFEVKPALLKVFIAEGKSVVSVAVKGNAEGDKLSSEGAGVTLCCKDGTDLPAGVDLYMVLPEYSFASGYTVTFTDAEGNETVKGTDKPVVWEAGKVYEVQNEFAPPPSSDYYADYSEGNDIIIAGKMYNKAVYGEPVLIKSGETYTISAAGVYFIENGASVTYSPSSSLIKAVIVGRDPAQRSALVQTVNFSGSTNGEIVLMNLDIACQVASGKYIFAVEGSNIPQRYAMDNCRVLGYDRKNMMYKKGDWMKELLLHNCDFQFTSPDVDLWLFNADSYAVQIDLIDIRNTLMWHTSAYADGKGFRITNGSSINVTNSNFINNTFINLTTRKNQTSTFSAKSSNAEATGNLFYLLDQPVNGKFFQQDSANPSVSGNKVYVGTDYTYVFNSSDDAEKLTESPFESIDVAAGAFVKKAAYVTYGAVR